MIKKLLILLFISSSYLLLAQTEIKGLVFDEYLEPFPGVTVKTSEGKIVTTNIDGEFTVEVKNFPVTLRVTLVGYQTEILEITSTSGSINVILKETFVLDQVVVSASRTPERIIESPVTIERLGVNDIKRTSSVSFYDAIANLKGIDTREASYGFKSFNTRGFSTFDNTRFVQLVDGVDTSIPATNFSAGNLVGVSELDIKSIEILPGASSALYGANAFNGILLMTTKSPFDYGGISTYFKSGFTTQKQGGDNPFYDVGVRMAYKFSDKLAGKANLTYLKAEEWHANDRRNTTGNSGTIIGGDESNPGYDGLNVYGDEVSVSSLRGVGGVLTQLGFLNLTPAQIALLPDVQVNRTGYAEEALLDYNTYNLKFDGSLHYRPFGNEDLEIILGSRFSRGTNIYQGANRYLQKDFTVEQHRLEFRGKNYFLRGYYVANDAGDYFDTRFLGLNINETWNPSPRWFAEYVGAYLQSLQNPNLNPHQQARAFADRNRLQPGTPEFNAASRSVLSRSISQRGASITDKTSYYHSDANYNFKDLVDFAEIQVGGSYRRFNVNSEGTLFTDANSKISFDEFGIYTQLQKKFLDDRMKFTGSIRYDKSTNFDGNFSPRVSLSYALGDSKNHIIRSSYQTGFRNPAIQEQYFGLPTGAANLIGGVADNFDRYSITVNSRNGTTNTLTAGDAFRRSFSLQSVLSGTPTKSNINLIKPEIVTAYEVGYRSILNLGGNILEVDLNGYFNDYKDFATTRRVAVPHYGGFNADGTPSALALQAVQNQDIEFFDVYTNSSADITSYGAGLGLTTKVFKGYDVGLSYNWAKFSFDRSSDPDFLASFNTPEHKVKFNFGNSNVFKNFGFNTNIRWQDSFLWEASFIRGNVAARTVLDAQLSYKVPSMKSRFKIGGTNLFGKEYTVAPGSGLVGSLYYISWTIND